MALCLVPPHTHTHTQTHTAQLPPYVQLLFLSLGGRLWGFHFPVIAHRVCWCAACRQPRRAHSAHKRAQGTAGGSEWGSQQHFLPSVKKHTCPSCCFQEKMRRRNALFSVFLSAPHPSRPPAPPSSSRSFTRSPPRPDIVLLTLSPSMGATIRNRTCHRCSDGSTRPSLAPLDLLLRNTSPPPPHRILSDV